MIGERQSPLPQPSARLNGLLVTTLTMIAVPPLRRLTAAILKDPAQGERSRYMFFFQFKGLAGWWLRCRNAALVERLWRKWSPGSHTALAAIERVRGRFRQPQVSSAALSYYRQTLDKWSKQGRKPRHCSTDVFMCRRSAYAVTGMAVSVRVF